MIQIVRASIGGADSFTVSGRIALRDDRGVGIRTVTVSDRDGIEIVTRAFDCPVDAQIEIERIERDRLPLQVTATDCSNGAEAQKLGAVWGPPSEPGMPLPGSALLCQDNSPCLGAQLEVQQLRNEILTQCGRIRAIESRRNGYAGAAAVMFAVFAALLAAAAGLAGIPFIGGILAAVAVIAALVALTAGIMLGYLAHQEQQRADEAQRELTRLREAFTEAAGRVGAGCNRDCISVDLTMPVC